MMNIDGEKAERWELIYQLISKFAQAMNDKDAMAVADCFVPDANFTNPMGRTASGRKAIADLHYPLFTAKPTLGVPSFYNAVLEVVHSATRFIKPDVAAIDILWTQTGVIAPDGSIISLRKGLINAIAVNIDGQWSFVVFHNMELKN